MYPAEVQPRGRAWPGRAGIACAAPFYGMCTRLCVRKASKIPGDQAATFATPDTRRYLKTLPAKILPGTSKTISEDNPGQRLANARHSRPPQRFAEPGMTLGSLIAATKTRSGSRSMNRTAALLAQPNVLSTVRPRS